MVIGAFCGDLARGQPADDGDTLLAARNTNKRAKLQMMSFRSVLARSAAR